MIRRNDLPPAPVKLMTSRRIRLRIAGVALLIVAGAIWKGDTAHSQSPSADKPVEQVRKNIQVLRGLPDSQLFPVMNFIGDALGVHCDYCHVTQGTDPKTGRDIWLYERDDKTEKIRGREMIKMVLEINKTSFGGDQKITCYSCHRGTTRVERVVPLPPVDFTLPRTDRKEPAPLSAEQILSNYIKAVGGQDTGAKFKTIVYTGIVERSQ